MSKPTLTVTLPDAAAPFAKTAAAPAARPDDVRTVITSLLVQPDLARVMIFPAANRDTMSFKKLAEGETVALGTVGRDDYSKLSAALQGSERPDAGPFASRVQHVAARSHSVTPVAPATQTLTHS